MLLFLSRSKLPTAAPAVPIHVWCVYMWGIEIHLDFVVGLKARVQQSCHEYLKEGARCFLVS